MVKQPVNFRMDEKLRDRAMKVAEERAESFTGLIERAVEMNVDFDLWFLLCFLDLAEKMRIPLARAIQGPAVSWYADLQARLAVWGPSPEPMLEFLITAQGPISAEALYHEQYRRFKKEEEMKRCEFLSKKAPEELTDEERSFLEIQSKPKSGWVGDSADPRAAILKAREEEERRQKE